MGRALLASDGDAGPKDPAGSLIFREQFSSVSASGRQLDPWMIPLEGGFPIHNSTIFTGQLYFEGPWWATNQHDIRFESWSERDQLPRLVTVISCSSPARGLEFRAHSRGLCATHEFLARCNRSVPGDLCPVVNVPTPPESRRQAPELTRPLPQTMVKRYQSRSKCQ